MTNDLPGKVITKIIEVDDTRKDDLFFLSNSFLVDYFVSAEAVIEYSNEDKGVILGKAIIDNYQFTISIMVKDNKIRVEVKDMYYGKRASNSTGSLLAAAISESYATFEYFEAQCDSMLETFEDKYLLKQIENW